MANDKLIKWKKTRFNGDPNKMGLHAVRAPKGAPSFHAFLVKSEYETGMPGEGYGGQIVVKLSDGTVFKHYRYDYITFKEAKIQAEAMITKYYLEALKVEKDLFNKKLIAFAGWEVDTGRIKE
jgi:hypothetical protein